MHIMNDLPKDNHCDEKFKVMLLMKIMQNKFECKYQILNSSNKKV